MLAATGGAAAAEAAAVPAAAGAASEDIARALAKAGGPEATAAAAAALEAAADLAEAALDAFAVFEIAVRVALALRLRFLNAAVLARASASRLFRNLAAVSAALRTLVTCALCALKPQGLTQPSLFKRRPTARTGKTRPVVGAEVALAAAAPSNGLGGALVLQGRGESQTLSDRIKSVLRLTAPAPAGLAAPEAMSLRGGGDCGSLCALPVGGCPSATGLVSGAALSSNIRGASAALDANVERCLIARGFALARELAGQLSARAHSGPGASAASAAPSGCLQRGSYKAASLRCAARARGLTSTARRASKPFTWASFRTCQRAVRMLCAIRPARAEHADGASSLRKRSAWQMARASCC